MTIIRLFLAAVVAFVLIAILSFIYLKWWQAMVVCAAVFVMFLLLVRLAIALFVRKLGQTVGNVFEKRGQNLRGAIVEVHSVAPVTAPMRDESTKQLEDATDDEGDEDEDDDEEEEAAPAGPLVHYRVDVTIRVPPRAIAAGVDDVQRAEPAISEVWHPNELVLADADAPEEPVPHVQGGMDLNALAKVFKQYSAGFRPEQITEPGRDAGAEGPEGAGDAFDAAGTDEVIEGPRSRRFSFTIGVPPELRALKFKYYGESFGRIELPR